MSVRTEEQKNRAITWFKDLRDQLCAAFEAIEDDCTREGAKAFSPARFERTSWDRDNGGGGGEMSVLKNGRVLEKAGVNVSVVHGEFSEEFRAKIPGAAEDPRFWAAGVSLVVHPRSPRAGRLSWRGPFFHLADPHRHQSVPQSPAAVPAAG